MFVLYAFLHNGITERPHENIFQKSGHLGSTYSELADRKIQPNSGVFFSIEPKYITIWVILVNLFVLYAFRHSGITEKPRDHVFQKSRHLS